MKSLERARRNGSWITALLTSPKRVARFFFSFKSPVLPKLASVLAVAYLIWPADLIPDIAPIMGWLDDVGFAAIAGAYLMRAVDRFDRDAPEKLLEADATAVRTPSS